MDSVFENNIYLLEGLLGKKEVSEKLDRFKFIFENTENSWIKNLERFGDQKIKYILICEAPPYSETEMPVFFYNQFDNKFNRTIWKVFFPNQKFPNNSEEYYQKLADCGFLLIDNLPFSANYASKRKNKAYKNLLRNSLDLFFKILNNEKIRIAEGAKFAFGFKVNAEKFIEITNGSIQLQSQQIFILNKKQIAANGSGFPSSENLSKIFLREYQFYKYYNGEEENPYWDKEGSQLDFQNPKSLFWHYERHFFLSGNNNEEEYKIFIENLIRNKLSEYTRSDYYLWELYFKNTIK